MSSNTLSRISATDFDRAVLHAQGVQLVEFTAAWCPPCHAIVPSLEALSREYAGRASVGQVDVDAEQQLAERYQIRAMPTLLFFKGGQVVDQMVGAASKSAIEARLRRALEAR